MTGWRCEDCGETFPEPLVKDWWDPRPEGAWERERQVLCPWCGSPYIEEHDEYEQEEEDEAWETK